jgi:acetylornithine deacetylase/succinyl-diaminopimelate desuccinylase-like protein
MEIEKYFEENLPRIKEELFELLAFESVGSEKERMPETLACADWLREHLAGIGFKAELLEVPETPPCVYGHLHVDDSYPTALLYGHYDLQPPGEVQQWHTPPFDPEERDGRIYARGARDNKGQFFFNLKAIEAAKKLGILRYNVKVMLDGEEESASLVTLGEIPKWREKLSCDVLFSSETHGGSDGTPAIVMGYKGIGYMRLNMYGANRSLHSGYYGGIVRNPALELSRIAASMFNPDGTIAVKGYMDDLQPVTPQERKLLAQTEFSEDAMKQELGIDAFCGDRRFTVQERVAFLPAIEFPGISGGYVGRAVRAIIPPMAQLKMTLRIGRGQDGFRLLKAIEDHIFSVVTDGVRLEIEKKGVVCPALSASIESKSIAKAGKIIERLFGKPPGFLWIGATLSAIAQIVAETECEPLLVGFGLPEDAEHGENESFALEQFKKGFLYATTFLSEPVE